MNHGKRSDTAARRKQQCQQLKIQTIAKIPSHQAKPAIMTTEKRIRLAIKYFCTARQKDKHNKHMTENLFIELTCFCITWVQICLLLTGVHDAIYTWNCCVGQETGWWSDSVPAFIGIILEILFVLMMPAFTRVMQIIKYEIRTLQNRDYILALFGVTIAVFPAIIKWFATILASF